MATEIIMPKVDMVMETGTFMEWLKDEGQPVAKGEPLFVIMTDKSAIECESPANGILSGIMAAPNDVIPVTQVIGYIAKAGEELPKTLTPAAVEVVLQKKMEPTLNTPDVVQNVQPIEGDKLLRATPLARSMARDMGIDLQSVIGSGPRGRIYKADVLEAAEIKQKRTTGTIDTTLPLMVSQPGANINIALPNARVRERIPMRGIRSITASRLSYSAQVSPHIYLTISIDMSEMLRWKGKSGPTIEKRLQSKLSLTAMIVFALSRVLTAHPYLNSSLADNEIILWDDVHVGIATALGDDLIVPVVRQAQQLSLEETVKEMNRLFEAARAHKLQPSEMSGSTFTISNLGMFGIEEFTAILNPPEAGILAVGKIVDTPVASAGQVFIQPMMRLTLTTDHRINDGVRAANFLNELKSVLENPYSLL
jgi:pyruvate dehydrogenase E2 component (dihydrolipoamide acetyltransferase)